MFNSVVASWIPSIAFQHRPNYTWNIGLKKTSQFPVLSPEILSSPFALLAQASWMETQTDDILLEYEEPFGPVMYEMARIKVNANAALEAFTGSGWDHFLMFACSALDSALIRVGHLLKLKIIILKKCQLEDWT